MSEGLLDDDAAPGVGRLLHEPGAGDALSHGREPSRRDRQVEGAVAARAPGGVKVIHHASELVVGGVVLKGAELHEAHPRCQLLPDSGTPWGAGTSPSRFLHVAAQVVVGPGASADAHQGEAGGEQAAVGQVVDGRQELVAGQITSDAEHHQNAGVRDTRKAKVAGVEKRVGRPRGSRRRNRSRGVGAGHVSLSEDRRSADQAPPAYRRRTAAHCGGLRRSDRHLTETWPGSPHRLEEPYWPHPCTLAPPGVAHLAGTGIP